MKKIELKASIEFLKMEELSDEERKLVESAIKATENSYAKYSNFHVGASVLLDDGRMVIGANQENAVFPVGLCAERVAIFAAQANYPEHAILKLAIAARNQNGLMAKPVSPCGSCRQVILEMEERYNQPIRILLYGTEGVYAINSVKDILPLCFAEESMM